MAREVIDAINRVFARTLEWQVDLLGWEDTLPGAARPQSLINADVDACDLFVGLLWKRWGNPTGVFSSGFEEEFQRATNRRRETGSPNIWIFFKSVDAESLEDPGPQLQSVMAFRKEREAARDILFKEFADADEWKEMLREYVERHILSVTTLPAPPPQSASVALPLAGAEGTAAAGTTSETSAASGQIREVLHDLDTAVSNEEDAGEFPTIRLQILAKSLLSAFYTGELLSAHEANLMYKHRSAIHLNPRERDLLLRSLVADREMVIPGWFSFREEDQAHLRLELTRWALATGPDEVRIAALALLASTNTRVLDSFNDIFLSQLLSAASWSVREAAIRYLAAVGQDEDKTIVDGLADPANLALADSVLRADLVLRLRIEPDLTVRDILSRPEARLPQVAVDLIRDLASDLETTLLHGSLAKHSESDLRKAAFSLLATRRALTFADVISIIEDHSAQVRALAPQALDSLQPKDLPPDAEKLLDSKFEERKTDADEREAVFVSLFKLLPEADLRPKLDWFNLSSLAAYTALGEAHFRRFSRDLRSDLASGFQAFQERSSERIKSVLGESAEDFLDQYEQKGLNEFIRNRFTEVALSALAKRGSVRDAALGRKYLQSADSEVQRAAVSLLARFGTRNDATSVLEVAMKAVSPTLKGEAAKSAAILSRGKGEVMVRLMKGEDSDLVRAAADQLPAKLTRASYRTLTSLVKSDNADVRWVASDAIARRVPHRELLGLLDSYLKRSMYYYNVVVRWDRELFLPTSLRSAYL